MSSQCAIIDKKVLYENCLKNIFGMGELYKKKTESIFDPLHSLIALLQKMSNFVIALYSAFLVHCDELVQV